MIKVIKVAYTYELTYEHDEVLPETLEELKTHPYKESHSSGRYGNCSYKRVGKGEVIE